MASGTTLRRVHAHEAVDTATAALVAAGSEAGHARIQAEHLVEGELRGHPSHGLRRLPLLVERIRAGLLDPRATPTFSWGATGALVVDGRFGFGPVTAYAAVDELLSRIDQAGVVVAAMHDTHHLGMLAPYVERLAERGCIGLVLSSTEGLVHPWGGIGPLLGTNPLGVAVPAADDTVTLDMSTGSVSAGKILDYAQRGLALPPGWAVDADGHPTLDAEAAAHGAISPFGGAKGYALGLTLGAIVGVLTGTAFGPDVRGTLDATGVSTKGDVIAAFRVEAFGQDAASAPLAAYLDRVRASGVDGGRVTVPGDRARDQRAGALEEGFDVLEELWSALIDLSETGGHQLAQKAGQSA